jgi:hypothetical protein
MYVIFIKTAFREPIVYVSIQLFLLIFSDFFSRIFFFQKGTFVLNSLSVQWLVLVSRIPLSQGSLVFITKFAFMFRFLIP